MYSIIVVPPPTTEDERTRTQSRPPRGRGRGRSEVSRIAPPSAGDPLPTEARAPRHAPLHAGPRNGEKEAPVSLAARLAPVRQGDPVALTAAAARGTR